MYKGSIVVFLPHCPTYGGNYGLINDIQNSTIVVQLCNPQSHIVNIDSKYITTVDIEQVPKELLQFLPTVKIDDIELRERLNLIDKKLNAIGIKLGL